MPEDAAPPRAPLFPFSRFVHREIIVLIILSVSAIAAFTVTQSAASSAHTRRVRDAAEWYARGEAARSSGQLDAAVDAFGRARALDRDREAYHLSFATALAEAGQHAAARQVLLTLRAAHPENPDVNIGLARLAARRGAPEDAVRFYQRALYGEWTPDRLGDRERVRVDLVEYQLANGHRDQAVAQLLLLVADLPRAAEPQIEAARLFLAAGEPERALEHYRIALGDEPDNQHALAGAGDAAFELGDVRLARDYYTRVTARLDGIDARRDLARLVMAQDPLQPGLSGVERRRRLARGHIVARLLIESCRVYLAGTASQEEQLDVLMSELAALDARLADNRAPRTEATIDDVAVIAGVVSFASNGCGPLTPEARAWLTIGRLRREGAS